jgi:hypothetical protein
MDEPYEEPDEKPLDPDVVRVQQKLRRLMMISGLTLGLGLLAVFMAILYRIFTYQSAGAPVPVVEGAAIPTVTRDGLGLPADARLVSTSLDADRIALTFEDGAGTTIVIFDLGRMTVASRLRLASE